MNLVSLNAEFSQLSARISKSNTEASRSISRLSSGNRITRAGDDVANLSVSTKLLSRTTALRSTLTNLSQASTLLQVAEGGMQQVEGLLQRMNQLSVMANSGTVSGRERAYLDVEFQNMKGEIDRIANTTNFNGVSLLNGIGNTSLETLSATFDTTYNGGTDSDNLTGTAGNERFFAGDGDDAIQGGGGNDFINAGLGNDYIDGGDGNDTITAAAEVQNSSLTLPFTNGLVMQMDAANTASITTSPGVVGTIQDQSTNNNDIFNDTGAVVSGSSTIGTENSLSFDGTSFLQVNDSANINLAAQNQRSVMITFETGADITTRQLLYEQGGQTNGFNIYIDNGNLYIGAWKSNGGAFNIHLSTAIQADTSYATGFVFDFSGAGNFRGYLNGAQFGSAAVGQNQAGHSGDIGIGGKNNDTRYFDGGSGGDGNAFIGEIGEVINYSGGLSTIEVDQVMDYLMSKWGIGAVNSGDEVVGGLGQDELIITGGTYNASLDADALIREIETITLSGNNNGHAIDVKDEYYTLGEGLENKTLVIDASGNTAGISVDAEQLSAENILTVIGSEGADTVTGGGEGNVTFSYAGATGGVEVDLVTGEATGSGQDVLTGVNGLIGGNYDDTITGSYGNDTISGGAGDDIVTDIGPTEGKLVSEGLVSYIDASSTGNITTHPGNVTLITDNGGTGNNAQNDTGAVLSGTDTINGVNSLTFDGASFLRIPNSNDINNNGQAQRSIYMTFETSDDVTTRQVLYEEGGGTNGFSIYIDQGQVYVAAWQGGGGTFNYLLSTEIEENTAYDVGFVFDSSVTQTFTGYLNKEQFGQLNANVAQLSHSGEIGIGASHGGTYFTDTGGVAGDGYIFRGEIGELLIYDTALTDAQNEQLQNYLIARRVGYFGGNDVLNGGDGNDTITGGLGNDTIDGGTGIDTAVFSGKRSNYSIQKISEGVYRVTDKTAGQNDGSDLIRDVERLQFSDGTLTLKRFDIAEENVTFQVREESEQYIEIVLPNVTVEHLFADVNVNILTQDAAEAAFNAVRLALNVVTAERAKTGALQSSVDTLHSANSEAIREQMAARAATSDTNIAVTSTEFASQLVQNEMSTSIAAQANTLRSDLVLAILEDGITLSA